MASEQRQPRPQSPAQIESESQLRTQSQAVVLIKPLVPIVSKNLPPLRGWLARPGNSHLGGQLLRRGRGVLLAAGLLLASQAPALAGSVTAESIWDQANAIQRATSQIPRGTTVTGSSCMEVDLRGGSTRYICTVTYSSAPPTPANQPSASPNSASPNPPSPNSVGPN